MFLCFRIPVSPYPRVSVSPYQPCPPTIGCAHSKLLSLGRSSRFAGSCLWVYDPAYPDLMHPFASAIDTDLPKPPEHTHIMLDFAAGWVEIPPQADDRYFARYPEESITNWHQRPGLTSN